MTASTGKGSNLCEYRKIVESGLVSGKGRIRAIIEKQSRRVPKKGQIYVRIEKCRIRVSTSVEKLSQRVPKKEESVRVSKNCPDEYRKRIESV